jgi:hypothetical protein
VSKDGVVDHSAAEVTPWLKLFVVTYNPDIPKLANQPLIDNGIVGGISFWISGPEQVNDHAELRTWVGQVRSALPPAFPVFTGGCVVLPFHLLPLAIGDETLGLSK